MTGDMYGCEDQAWYCHDCLVTLVGSYLLVYFLLDYDVTSPVEYRGILCGCWSVSDGNFLSVGWNFS
jgi:hypothetical protein